MDTFLKGYKEQSQDPSQQLLLQSVKADKRRLEDEVAAAKADPAYKAQLTKQDIFVIEANFKRLADINRGYVNASAGVKEGFQGQCTEGGDPTTILTYLNDARDTIIYIYTSSYTLTPDDYTTLNASLMTADQCMQTLIAGTASNTPPTITSLDTFISTTNNLEAQVVAYNQAKSSDPPSGTQCSQGGDSTSIANYIRDAKDTIIFCYSMSYTPEAGDYDILNATLADADKCMQMLQNGAVTGPSPVITGLTNFLSITTDMEARLTSYLTPVAPGGDTGPLYNPTPSDTIAPAAPGSGTGSLYNPTLYGPPVATDTGLTGPTGLPGVTSTPGDTGLLNFFQPAVVTTGSTGPSPSIFGPGGVFGTGTASAAGATGPSSSVFGSGGLFDIVSASATGPSSSVFGSGGLFATGATGATGAVGSIMNAIAAATATGATGTTNITIPLSTFSMGSTGPTGNITLAQAEDLVVRIDTEIARLS